MKRIYVFLCVAVFVFFLGCSSHNQHVATKAMEDFASGMKQYTEAQVMIEKERQQLNRVRQERDLLIGESISILGKPDFFYPYADGKVFSYLWLNKSLSDVIAILGKPDRIYSDSGMTIYVWGSYRFAYDSDSGLACVQKVK